MNVPTLALATLLAVALSLRESGAATALTAIPSGKSKVVMQLAGRPLEVFCYRPAKLENPSLLIVIHGLSRNADDYRDHAIALAERFHLLVAAPHFDAERFSTDAFQHGGIVKSGVPQPLESWTCQAIPQLLEEVRRREQRPELPYYLIGHSAGGQFLVRLAAFLPGEATRIVATNPGTHLFPVRDAAFPYGFGGLPTPLSDDAALQRYLAAPLTLFLGTADTGTYHLNVSPEAMRQGPTRLARSRACFSAAQALAQKQGWPFHWRLVEVEGVAHEAAKMFAAPNAREALFGK